MGKHVAIMTPAQQASEDYAQDPCVHGFDLNVERSWMQDSSGTFHGLWEYVPECGEKATGRHSKFVVRTFCTCGNDLGAFNL